MLPINSSRFVTKLQPIMGQLSRQMTAISGPPRVRISTAEKAVHGVAIVVGVMAIPTWVLINIKNYRARE